MIKKHIETFAGYAGIVTICFEWLAVALFYLLRPSAFSGENPLSYFASYPETRVVFSVCLTIAAISFWIFTRYYLNKHYVVPVRMFTASMLGYGVLALTPFDPTDLVSEIIHKVLALFFSLTYLAGIYLMGRHNKDATVRRVSYGAATLCGLILIVFLVTPKDSQFVLLFEAISAVVGQLWIVWISFHSFQKKRASGK
jgi:hypothetical protein